MKIQAIEDNNMVTIAHLESTLGVGHTTIKNILREMQNEQYVRRVGPDKGGHWEVL